MDKPGRHRYVLLKDLVDYQERTRSQRRSSLEGMVADAEEAGLYAKTGRPPPSTR